MPSSESGCDPESQLGSDTGRRIDDEVARHLLRPLAEEEPPASGDLGGRVLRHVASWTLLRESIELATGGIVRFVLGMLPRRRPVPERDACERDD